MVGATSTQIIGPFESARFAQPDGSLSLTFAAASGSPNATVECYRLPIV